VKACRFSVPEEARAAFALGSPRYLCAICGEVHEKGEVPGPCAKRLASEMGAGLRSRTARGTLIDWNLPLGEFGVRDGWWLHAHVLDARSRANSISLRLNQAKRRHIHAPLSEYEWLPSLEPDAYRKEVEHLQAEFIDAGYVREALRMARELVSQLLVPELPTRLAGWYRRDGVRLFYRRPGGDWEECIRRRPVLPAPSELTLCRYVGDEWTPGIKLLRIGRFCVFGAIPSSLLFGWGGLAGMWVRRVISPEEAAELAGEPFEPEFWLWEKE
jgi:hypothetical protein